MYTYAIHLCVPDKEYGAGFITDCIGATTERPDIVSYIKGLDIYRNMYDPERPWTDHLIRVTRFTDDIDEDGVIVDKMWFSEVPRDDA